MIEQFVNFVIRPPRAEYNPDQYLWEPEFTLAGRKYKRLDLELTNGRNQTLKCSHYVPAVIRENTALPCVIYCHGNRADANEAAVILLSSNITPFALNFAGSGLSEGEYVSLGWHEIMQGLLDQYTVAGNGKAQAMVVRMADYFSNRVKNVIQKYSIERHWTSLNEETRGMNLYQHYIITNDHRHLVLTHLFDKPCFLELLTVQADSLSNFHANTHIPVVIGGQMRYEVTGDPLYKRRLLILFPRWEFYLL